MRVGNQDILLPTTMVGNYPNPRWYDGHAFAAYPKGEFVYDAISREAFEDAVAAIVHDQEAAGIDIISDGKVYGGDSPYGQILYHYYERMAGYKMSGPPIGLPIYSTLYAPTVVGEVSRLHPFHLAALRAVRKATKKPVKISYNGIQVLTLASNDTYYNSNRELARAIAKAFHEDFLQLAEEGVDIIQLDEFVWPYGMSDWEVEAFNLAVDEVPGRAVLGPHLLGQLLRHAGLLPRRGREGVRRLGARQAPVGRRRARARARRSSRRRSTPTWTSSTTRSRAAAPTTCSRWSTTTGTATSSPASSTSSRRSPRPPTRSPTASASASRSCRPSGSGCRPTAA